MLLYACTIFTSAFLLFLVQPIIAKQILPWFGGSASVWATCLVFFQTTLLLGYAYADADVAPSATTWIPLTYYGLIFHDMKAPGPYSLFSTMLSTLDSDVAQESDVVPNAHTTKAYKVDEFGSQPFNDPEYMQKAAHYDDLAKSKRNAPQQ